MGDDFIFTPETCKLIKNILQDSINIIKLINEIKTTILTQHFRWTALYV